MRIFARHGHYIVVKPGYSCLALLLALNPHSSATPADPSPAIAPVDPLILQVQVVEGEGIGYLPGSRAVKGITIRVSDEVGHPVSGAAVSFKLPEDGATGVFQNNTKTEIAATQSDGRASVWGMKWGKIPGLVSIRITAAKGATRAGTTATQIISETATTGQAISTHLKPSKERIGGGGRRKWLWIGVAAAGLGGGALAYEEMRKAGSQSSGSAAAAGVSIGAPQISLGAPH